MLGDGQRVSVLIDSHKHQPRRGHHAFFVAVNIELARLDRNRDGLVSDADNVPVYLDEVVLLDWRFKQDLLHFQGDHIWTKTHLIDKAHSQFVNPAQHGPAKKIVVYAEVVLFTHFDTEQLHDTKVHICVANSPIMSPRHLFPLFSALGACFLTCLNALTQTGIAIDHDFSDWNPANDVTVTDTTGPLVAAGFESDASNLYFHLVYDRLIALDEAWVSHGTRLGVDVDGNPSTGQIVGGFQGADIVIHLQDRYVNENGPGGTTNQYSFNDRHIRMAPTYGGDEHEVSLGRAVNGIPVSGTVRWTVRCVSGQQVSGEVNLSNTPAIPMATPLERAEETEVRIAFWNVNRRMDETPALQAMGRILQAVQPDVIGLSEVEDFSAEHVQNLLDDWLPIEGQSWHVAKDDWDLMVCSRWPITAEYDNIYRQFPVIVNAPWEGDLMVAASHLKCCNGAEQRRTEADEYMAFLRDAMTEGGVIDLPFKTPVVYGGDLNMVGPGWAMQTLLTGNIHDESTHGPDFAPDWDGTSLLELPCLQTDRAMDYTWRNDYSEWGAGKLDYILVQDGAVDVLRNFTIETSSMTPERRQAYGLQPGDDLEASDHYIVVADLKKRDRRPGTKPVKLRKAN